MDADGCAVQPNLQRGTFCFGIMMHHIGTCRRRGAFWLAIFFFKYVCPACLSHLMNTDGVFSVYKYRFTEYLCRYAVHACSLVSRSLCGTVPGTGTLLRNGSLPKSIDPIWNLTDHDRFRYLWIPRHHDIEQLAFSLYSQASGYCLPHLYWLWYWAINQLAPELSKDVLPMARPLAGSSPSRII
jgi:hypothetical protein